MRNRRRETFEVAILGAMLLVLCAWCARAIDRMSFDIDGVRAYCLWDDAMVSMTYARNFVEGLGLTWSRRGDAVEGFTHPLWVAMMVVVNLFPVALTSRSLFVQLFSAACLVGAVVEVRRLTAAHFAGGFSSLPATIATALYFPLALWSMLGMESGLSALLIARMTRQALDVATRRKDAWLGFCVTSTLATLLRVDLVLFVVAGGAAILAARGRSVLDSKRFWGGVGLLIGANVAYLAFRAAYYGDVLPNTYYLKMTGTPLDVRVLRGLDVTGKIAFDMRYLLACVGVGSALAASRKRVFLLPIAVVVIGFGYSIWVGGDAWEWPFFGANRFVAPVVPMVFVLVNGLLALAHDQLRGRLARHARLVSATVAVFAALVTLGAVWEADGLASAPHRELRWQQLMLEAEIPHVQSHRWWLHRLPELQQRFDRRASIAIEWAGIPAYFSDWKLCDILGYNDRHIAHGPNTRVVERSRRELFHPGHMKWDLDYTLGVLRPDVVMDPWSMPTNALPIAAQRHGYRQAQGYWYRPDSPWVDPEPTPR